MSSVMKHVGSELGFTNDQVDLIKRTIAKDATDDELALFLHQAKKTGLDPLSKQIYFQKYKNYKTGEGKVTIIVGIDGYRIIAGRTGLYAGSDDAVFDDERHPSKASVTVYKIVGGIRCPFTASARWDEYCPTAPNDHMWKKMPTTMLAKCAEGLALRKAFPAELSGTYTDEEMQQAPKEEGKVIEVPTKITNLPTVNESTGEVIDAVVEDRMPQLEVHKMIEAFAAIDLSLSDLEAWLGKSLEVITGADLQKLRGYYYERKTGYKSE